MIKHSAIKKDNIVYVGKRHHNCFATMAECGVNKIGAIQGFVTDTGEFLTREEAAKHALDCGQIKELKFPSGKLYSEDSY